MFKPTVIKATTVAVPTITADSPPGEERGSVKALYAASPTARPPTVRTPTILEPSARGRGGQVTARCDCVLAISHLGSPNFQPVRDGSQPAFGGCSGEV
jgi:hypothetical protein